MIEIAPRRGFRASSHVRRRVDRNSREPAADGKIKAPTTVGRMWLVELGILGVGIIGPAGVCLRNLSDFNHPTAIARL
jgi:hypothetical protein